MHRSLLRPAQSVLEGRSQFHSLRILGVNLALPCRMRSERALGPFLGSAAAWLFLHCHLHMPVPSPPWKACRKDSLPPHTHTARQVTSPGLLSLTEMLIFLSPTTTSVRFVFIIFNCKYAGQGWVAGGLFERECRCAPPFPWSWRYRRRGVGAENGTSLL